MSTIYIEAETTSERFAELTGLSEGRGFVMRGHRPAGIYPATTATEILSALCGAGVQHFPTPALTVNEGRCKLERSA